ncbi:TPA: hypothetical protein R1960_002390 [Staphylococcus delphini]|nr:hypothetical protein [Staphylococcus delphini]
MLVVFEENQEVININLIPFNIGIVIVGKGVIKKSGRKTLNMSDNIKLLESLMRSLDRENRKDKLKDKGDVNG